MTPQSFVDQINKLYKDGNEAKWELIIGWLIRCKLTSFQIDSLFEEFTESYKYKSFPSLAEVKETWLRALGERSFEKFDNPVVKQRVESKELMPDTIIRKCAGIRKKIYNSQFIDPIEMDFLAQWGDLLSENLIAKDKHLSESDVKNRNEHVKACILNNAAIDPIAEPLDTDIKINGMESTR